MRVWLRNCRERCGLTQENLAEKSGISRQMVGHLETGKANPSVKTAMVIADILGFEWTMFYSNCERNSA